MVHTLLLALSGLLLCGGMTLVADRFASSLFRTRDDIGTAERS